METKAKYVTRRKRTRQLEREVEQLKEKVAILSSLLDDAHGLLLRSNKHLARAVERDFHAVKPPEPEETEIRRSRTTPRLPQRNSPLLPRADLVGRTASPYSMES
ncbi:hypothetical protein [Nodularia sp. UHCC 0506]|uniref:hypothetical protein n=1 Tax=Nodularia sp. UHCC 0506 TaxID=3110243 RepID=UPI002B21CD47|nr:hypothetical protein [Nodularia sp. UHCC 0506]MEA5515526.1 hypothetical protein [Nodularia sp. UHCC 0506]